MANDPFTITIFVPDGDPEGVRIIHRAGWTGLGIVFPREKWPTTRRREEFSRAGVYVLVGYEAKEGAQEDDLPTVYVGEGELMRTRIESHFQSKDFWDKVVAFATSDNSLNKAHVRWLEYALVNRAAEAKQCKLDNGTEPQEPRLSEAEKSDMKGFLRNIVQILPLVGVGAFEVPKAVAEPQREVLARPDSLNGNDTVIVPAKPENFKQVFLGENCWYAIRISPRMLPKIKYVAAYQSDPEMQVTHYAPVAKIEPYGAKGKYKLVFAEPAKPVGPIPYADAPRAAMMGPKYTTFGKLMKAKKLTELF